MSKLLGVLAVAAAAAALCLGVYDLVQYVQRLEGAIEQLHKKHQEVLKARGELAMESGYSQGVHDTTLAAQQYIVESCHSRNHELVAADQTFICQPKQEI